MRGPPKNKKRRQGRPQARRPSRPPRQAAPPPGTGVVVNGYSDGWLQKGFPWVYREEITAQTPGLAPGAVATIYNEQHAVRGVGVFDAAKVAVRRFREDAGPLDQACFQALIQAAFDRRVLPPETTAWRLVHGESDDMPGVRIEVFGGLAVITLDTPALQSVLPPLAAALRAVVPLTSIWLHWRPSDEDGDARFSDLSRGLYWGEAPEGDPVVSELGLRYRVRPTAGHDIGLFCDMREVRAWMAPHWAGRRVLNLFCFTGAYSVSAAAHGAREVVSVDLSGPIMERVRGNFDENGLSQESHQFWVEDTFKALDRLRRKGEQFDVIVADPPSFSHGPEGTWSVAKDYKRLVAACLRVLAPGGWLIAATNLGAISPRDFKGYLIDGAQRAGRRLRVIHEASTPIDVPAALHFPESRYLKCWVLEG